MVSLIVRKAFEPFIAVPFFILLPVFRTFVVISGIYHDMLKLSSIWVKFFESSNQRTKVLKPYLFFFYLDFLSRIFTIHRTSGKGGGYLFNSSLPLPPAPQKLRHQPGDYCRHLTSVHSQQPGSNRESLVSELKSLITKLLTCMCPLIRASNVLYNMDSCHEIIFQKGPARMVGRRRKFFTGISNLLISTLCVSHFWNKINSSKHVKGAQKQQEN